MQYIIMLRPVFIYVEFWAIKYLNLKAQNLQNT